MNAGTLYAFPKDIDRRSEEEALNLQNLYKVKETYYLVPLSYVYHVGDSSYTDILKTAQVWNSGKFGSGVRFLPYIQTLHSRKWLFRGLNTIHHQISSALRFPPEPLEHPSFDSHKTQSKKTRIITKTKFKNLRWLPVPWIILSH